MTGNCRSLAGAAWAGDVVFSVHKIVGSLPAPLEPDAIYAVRVGAGFDLHITDDTGSIAHSVNLPAHQHIPADITGLQGLLDAKLNSSAVSAFAMTLLDDAAASNMRTTLGLGTAATWTAVPNGHITNARMANMATSTVKGRIAGTTGAPEDLTVAQLKTLLALAIADVAGLQSALNAKANTSHTHTIAQVTNLQDSLDSKADSSAIPVVVSFATDAEAEAYHTANPTHIVFSREA